MYTSSVGFYKEFGFVKSIISSKHSIPNLTWYVKDEDLIEEGKRREEEYAAQEEVDQPLLVPPAAPQLLQHVVELQRHRGFTGRENLIEPTTCFFAAKI